mgnify:CR=1 FL=1
MTQELWTAVDRYAEDMLVGEDPVLAEALRASDEAGLPSIQVSATQGKWLFIQAYAMKARRILEIGTLGGYSTIWLGRALGDDGRLISLEYEPKHAEVARRNIARAGLDRKIEVRTGPALNLLPGIEREGAGPFDLIFIDADKENYPGYFEWGLKLVRSRGLIIADNAVRDGEVVKPESEDPRVHAIRRMWEMMASDSRVSATVIQTVGAIGRASCRERG